MEWKLTEYTLEVKVTFTMTDTWTVAAESPKEAKKKMKLLAKSLGYSKIRIKSCREVVSK